MDDARPNRTRSYNAAWFHDFVADDEEMPEIATNEEWRGIMVRARKAHGLSQEQLGDKVGLSQVMISKLESAQASSTYIMRICRVLHIQPPEHYENEDQKQWANLGRVLRARKPEQYRRALALVEAMTDELPAEDQPAESKTDK